MTLRSRVITIRWCVDVTTEVRGINWLYDIIQRKVFSVLSERGGRVVVHGKGRSPSPVSPLTITVYWMTNQVMFHYVCRCILCY